MLVVLVFVLLEHEPLRDGFIRVAGGTNIRLTTLALNDAGERLSRSFVSQFAFNLGVGVAIALGLAVLGVPQATLWGALALREQRLDARHVSMADLDAGSRPPDANPAAIAIAYLVSAFPSAEREHSEQAADRVRQQLPSARVASVFLPGVSIQPELPAHVGNVDFVVSSFVEAVQVCLGRQRPETP